ncbi:MAG: Fic family protein [Candidatus Gastranaerophilales bacterium]|nr:Fic family protein [Candidatus Gastranaerophilales bacterium]
MEEKLNLSLPEVDFNSNLVQLILQLEVLRNNAISIETQPILFNQVKAIFHMIESLQSARIEGNRTTISDYVSAKFEKKTNAESIKEIENIENTIDYVNKRYDEDKNFKLSAHFIKELHALITKDLKNEGSKESGKFRTCNVRINNAIHTPPDMFLVNDYMEQLIDWINKDDKTQMQLLKVAIAHHCFTWIHPFDNGNGRMSRILTYTMLRQYGFDMAYLLNSTAVFCMDRNKYFDMLQKADEGDNVGQLAWCEYVLNGINNEMSKVSNLMNKTFFSEKIVKPAINRAYDLHFISNEYKQVLLLSLKQDNSLIKSADIQKLLKDKTTRQVTSLITKMVETGLLTKPKPKSRMYMINLLSKDLARGVIEALYNEKFISIEN